MLSGMFPEKHLDFDSTLHAEHC